MRGAWKESVGISVPVVAEARCNFQRLLSFGKPFRLIITLDSYGVRVERGSAVP